MRKISMFLLAIAVIAGMSTAYAQDKAAPKQNPSFQKADTNGDGVLSTEEYQAAMKRIQMRRVKAKQNNPDAQQRPWGPPPAGRGQGWQQGPKDGQGQGMRRGPKDGQGQGWQQGPKDGSGQGWQRGSRGPQGGPGGPGGPRMMLHRADTDQDGQVTKKEFSKAAPNAPEDAFKRMDRNGDGVLNREDRPEDGSGRRGGSEDGFGPQGRRGGPQGQRGGPQGGPGQGPRIKAMDTNEDGNISPKEFTAGHPNAPKDAFTRMDTNGDGVLNREDFQGRERGQGPGDGSGRRGGRRGAPPAPVE